MTTTATARRVYEYRNTIGIDEFVGRGFRHAVDLVSGPNGLLYVLQRGEQIHKNPSIKILNVDEEFFSEFGDYGEASGQMVWPAGIAIDAKKQTLYVSDDWNHRVLAFTTEGQLVTEWGQRGNGDGQFYRPSGLEFGKDGNLLVVDAGNHRVQKFTPDGKFLGKFGGYGKGEGQFNMPWGVAVNRQGEIYVTDWRNDRVEQFTAEGKFIRAWGSSGAGEGQFNRPAGIAVDREGDVYVVDWHNNRVQVFDGQGRFLTRLQGDAAMSSWGAQLLSVHPEMTALRDKAKDLSYEKRLWLPRGVETDDQGRVIIMDSGRGRLQIYNKKG